MKKETYCLACRKYTKNNNPKIVRNRQNRLMIQSNCANCGSKKLKNTTKPSSSILADELHKPIIRKFSKRKVYSQFKDNIWGVDLADMQSLSRKCVCYSIKR